MCRTLACKVFSQHPHTCEDMDTCVRAWACPREHAHISTALSAHLRWCTGLHANVSAAHMQVRGYRLPWWRIPPVHQPHLVRACQRTRQPRALEGAMQGPPSAWALMNCSIDMHRDIVSTTLLRTDHFQMECTRAGCDCASTTAHPAMCTRMTTPQPRRTHKCAGRAPHRCGGPRPRDCRREANPGVPARIRRIPVGLLHPEGDQRVRSRYVHLTKGLGRRVCDWRGKHAVLVR
jgi:hypothetical protein